MSDFDQINLIGVEIEGRWNEMPPVGELDYDGSVEFDGRTGMGSLGDTIDPEGPLIGEAVSDPLSPGQAIAWLDDNYPAEVNRSCGLHVHISLPPPNYQLLMDRPFYDFFRDRMEAWGEENPVPDAFWDRMNGHNSTCRHEWMPDSQIHGGHNTRYTIWNFQAYRSHGTAECRVLPAFEMVPAAQDAVMEVCEIVCDYLADTDPEPCVLSYSPHRTEPTTEEI
jgi:hypothetical protein